MNQEEMDQLRDRLIDAMIESRVFGDVVRGDEGNSIYAYDDTSSHDIIVSVELA